MPNTLGIVIAGGLSTRMGRDKAAVLLGGVPLALRALNRLRPQVSMLALNADTMTDGIDDDVTRVADAVPGHLGPLAGILSGLHLAQDLGLTHVATVAGDTPFFPTDIVHRLATASSSPDMMAVAASAGALHPVFGLWPASLAGDLADFLADDPKRRVRGFIERHPHVVVDISLSRTRAGVFDPFLNINTPEDLERATRLLADIEDAHP